MDSFVYIWTNITTNQKYIGVHKGTPDDGYVCSSKIMLKEYKTNPSDFIRHIIAYGTFKEMYNLETKLLVEVDAAKNPNYYNQSNNNGKFYISKQSEATKEKIRKKALGRTPYNKGVPNPKQSEKMKNNNPMKNPEIALKVSEKLKGRPSHNSGKSKHNPIKYTKSSKYGKDGRKKTIWTFPNGSVIIVEDTRKMCENVGLSYSAVRHKIGKGPYVTGTHKGLQIDRYDYSLEQ